MAKKVSKSKPKQYRFDDRERLLMVIAALVGFIGMSYIILRA